MAEFFHQGEQEAKAGLPVSPLCAAASLDVPKSQCGFIDFVARPILNAVYDFCTAKNVDGDVSAEPKVEDSIVAMKHLLDDNYEFWQSPESRVIAEEFKTIDRLSILNGRARI